MVLPSYSFIFIFLPAVVILYLIANSRKLYTAGKIVLLLSSLFFYALLTPGIKGLAALLLSVAFCYCIATYGLAKIDRPIVRKLLLTLGIIINIALLIYCKYLSYIESLIEQAGGAALTFEAIVVPVGISYFTFSQTAYLVDTYRDPAIRYSALDYVLFVCFFPKITVGPIALSTEMIPQFNDSLRKDINYDNMSKGFYRFTLGLGKKLLLADNLGKFVDIGYANIPNLGTGDALLVILSYTLQIYYDFSGYCDLASGICLILNLDLCENFDGPYRSLSITEFWKRWHITLTRFFRNYLYIPMGGNRKGKIRTYFNNLFIFLVSGLWHGAATHFVLWGGIHGVGMIISKLISPVTKKVPKYIRWFLTFAFVNLAWVFFRSDDTTVALSMLKRLFTGGFSPLNSALIAACIPTEFQLIQWLILKAAPDLTYYSGCAIWIVLVAIGIYFSAFSRTAKERCDGFVASGKKVAVTVILFTWAVLSLSEVAEFIYVNF
ncbi:MAG: MBOAT family protein [Lachnospiraceae bacterium]|nr:MBOAT family protein [Lachnospiraceae bacterium]